MKRTFSGILALGAIGLLSGRFAAENPPRQPVYVYLTTSVSDYVNQDITGERLHRLLPMVERYRAEDPSAVVTICFSGAMSGDLERRNSENHLLDLLRRGIKSGAVEAGYDGAEEPTTAKHPMMDLSKSTTAEERWRLRLASAEEVLSGARDPMTGAAEPGKTGGLPEMQRVFGPAAALRGIYLMFPNLYGPIVDVGVDSEIVHLIRKYNTTAIMLGAGDYDAAHTGSTYRAWTEVFGRDMSPAPNTPPELYWQDEMLRTAETSIRDLRLLRAMNGVENITAALNGLDRSRVRIVHLELASPRIYEKPAGPPHPGMVPPLRYAWSHPEAPAYPAALRYSKEQIDAAYAREDDVMKYLVSEFFPANPGSRFVSNSDLKKMTPPGWGYELKTASLEAAVRDELKAWDGKPPVDLRVEGHYLSDADLFAAMANALAGLSNTGHLPDTVRVERVYGPMRTIAPNPPAAGDVSAGAVAKACAEMNASLHDDKWTPVPRNMIPSSVGVGGITVNPAQFLRLMAEALTESSGAQLQIKPMNMFWGTEAFFYKRRPASEMGVAWTFRPAPVAEPK